MSCHRDLVLQLEADVFVAINALTIRQGNASKSSFACRLTDGRVLRLFFPLSVTVDDGVGIVSGEVFKRSAAALSLSFASIGANGTVSDVPDGIVGRAGLCG